jgi:hypothetical protein
MTTCELSGVHTAPVVKLSTDCDDAAVEGSLPTQPVVSVESLAVAYVIVLHSLAETLFEQTGPADGGVGSKATAPTDEYLQVQERAKPLATASHIVKVLTEALGVPERGRALQSRVLASLVGHRIESDVQHFNDLKARYRFV